MEQSLKERLIGAAVLVVLAVIFVPMVLDGPETPPAAVPASIAAVPSGASTFRYDLNAPLPADGAAAPPTTPAATVTTRVATTMPQAKPAEPKSGPVPEARPATEVAPKPTAAPKVTAGWAAQVGSFSKQATADSVATELKDKGFQAFVMTLKDSKQTLYRVRVGPVATREAADALAKKITAKTGQTARPVQHP